MTHLMMCRKTMNRKLPLGYFWINSTNKTLLVLSRAVPRKSLGPISRHRVADILPHMRIVSRASRPGLLAGFLRILCSGLCTAQRFHTAEHDHTCRHGCPDEPDSLTHYNECPRLYNIFVSFWRHATMSPQRNHFLHDLITCVFMRSLQYGIVVLGFLDAFVYAHHKHRLDSENSGNFGDCVKGRVRLMTAITPAYAHAYKQFVLRCTLLASRATPSVFPNPSQDILFFAVIVPLQKNLAIIIMGGLFIRMAVLALWMVKPLLDGV